MSNHLIYLKKIVKNYQKKHIKKLSVLLKVLFFCPVVTASKLYNERALFVKNSRKNLKN